jgi:hypothetical protein
MKSHGQTTSIHGNGGPPFEEMSPLSHIGAPAATATAALDCTAVVTLVDAVPAASDAAEAHARALPESAPDLF